MYVKKEVLNVDVFNLKCRGRFAEEVIDIVKYKYCYIGY